MSHCFCPHGKILILFFITDLSCFKSSLLLLLGFKGILAIWLMLSRTCVIWLRQSLCSERLYFVTDVIDMEMT